VLLRLNISDSKTGICIFEKIWNWSGTSVAEGICKLVLTFHKISKETGDSGEVSGVLFETPPNSKDVSKQPSSSSSSLSKRSKAVASPFIALACNKDDQIGVSVFHDQTDNNDTVQTYVKSILAEFIKLNGKELTGLRSTLDSMIDNPNPLAKPEEIIVRFKQFDAVAEHIQTKLGL